MAEFEIAGIEVVRWLESPAADVTLLLGCGFDDGESEDLLVISAVDLAARRVSFTAARTLPMVRFGAGTVVSGEALRDAVLAATPADQRAENAAYEEIRGLVPLRPPSREDLDAIVQAYRSHQAGELPDVETRHGQARALKRSQAWRAGVVIAGGWRRIVLHRGGPPEIDVSIHLARFQREASDARGALATIKELRATRLQMADRERAIVATMEGAVHADLFEAQRRNVDHFEQAYVCARRAFAADPNGEEVKALYRRLDSLAPKRP